MPWVICTENQCPDCGADLETSGQIRRPRWWARRVDGSTWRYLAAKPEDWRGRASPPLSCPEGHGAVLVEREPEPARVPLGPPPPEAVTVWVAPTGTHYHEAGCGLLQGRGRAVRLSEALAAGLEPCRLYERRRNPAT
jgi:hypothetical protein